MYMDTNNGILPGNSVSIHCQGKNVVTGLEINWKGDRTCVCFACPIIGSDWSSGGYDWPHTSKHWIIFVFSDRTQDIIYLPKWTNQRNL